MEELYEGVRRRKAEDIWAEEIYYNHDLNPIVTLKIWIYFLISNICSHSSKIFLSQIHKMIDTKYGKIPREKAVELWTKEFEEITNEIFQDFFHRSFDIRINKTVLKQINIQLEKEFEKNYNYCLDVINRILQILSNKEYSVVISSSIGEGRAYKIPPETKEIIDYIDKVPWLKLKYKFEADDKNYRFMNAVNFINSMLKSNDLIIREECKSSSMDFIVEYEKPISKKKQKDLSKESNYLKWGEDRFNTFNEYLQKKLLEFCKDLGYRNKKKLYLEIGKFESIFPLPFIPRDPKHIIEKNHFPKEPQIPS